MKSMFLKYFIKIVESLNNIHVGTIQIQAKAVVKLSFLVSPFALLWDKLNAWTIDNQDFILVVLGAIIVDHILGSVKHAYFDFDFTWRQNGIGLLTKIGLLVAGGFLFEGLQVIIKHDNLMTSYLQITTRLIVFLYPAGSAFGNSSVISGGKFPPKSWLDKLNSFQRNLNPKDIITKNSEDD